jgi:hypothetical protein
MYIKLIKSNQQSSVTAITLHLCPVADTMKKPLLLSRPHSLPLKKTDLKVVILVLESEMTNLLAARCQVYMRKELPTRSVASRHLCSTASW